MTESPLKTLIVGADGLIGTAFHERLRGSGRSISTTSRHGCDADKEVKYLELSDIGEFGIGDSFSEVFFLLGKLNSLAVKRTPNALG